MRSLLRVSSSCEDAYARVHARRCLHGMPCVHLSVSVEVSLWLTFSWVDPGDVGR